MDELTALNIIYSITGADDESTSFGEAVNTIHTLITNLKSENDKLLHQLSSRQNDHNDSNEFKKIVEWAESKGFNRDNESIKDFFSRLIPDFKDISIHKIDSFRSTPLVNQNDDMVKVSLTMPIYKWKELKQLIQPYQPLDNDPELGLIQLEWDNL